MPSLDYSRFDHIGDSDDDDEGPGPGLEGAPQELLQALALQRAEAEGVPAAAPQPPDNVLEDLEDYFERWDARRAGGTDPSESASAASVERFEGEDFALLDRLGGMGGAECAICLASGPEQEPAVALPCAARHRFHEECARGWFERNTTCPLCRVDVRCLVRAASPRRPPPSPRGFGFTRDGGVIARYDPAPPPELPRPAYIPPELHTVAELVEIDYPDRGVARVWRVPR